MSSDDQLTNLPNELKLQILSKTKTSKEARRLCAVNTSWREFCSDPITRPYTLSFDEAVLALRESTPSETFIYINALERGVEDASIKSIISLIPIFPTLEEVLPDDFHDRLLNRAIRVMKICDAKVLTGIFPKLLQNRKFIERLPKISFAADLLREFFPTSPFLYEFLLKRDALFQLTWSYTNAKGMFYVQLPPDSKLDDVYPEFKRYNGISGIDSFRASFKAKDPELFLFYITSDVKVEEVDLLSITRSSAQLRLKGSNEYLRYDLECLFI